ncbi:hypothetical protein CALCODRAFT_486765 [Calocera cornea HHB12733]|uniref:Uncharacterized protein n=1 Tax=Calocera cornea HHB12733 TaxID=1353952 RepID=A0A165DJI7_9BASI|nr:hypothetical protein CALCODRAFT_486765 [Calocera cornea HHB12733]
MTVPPLPEFVILVDWTPDDYWYFYCGIVPQGGTIIRPTLQWGQGQVEGVYLDFGGWSQYEWLFILADAVPTAQFGGSPTAQTVICEADFSPTGSLGPWWDIPITFTDLKVVADLAPENRLLVTGACENAGGKSDASGTSGVNGLTTSADGTTCQWDQIILYPPPQALRA